MSCLFCGIGAGTQEAEIVLRDDLCTAFLDHRPVFPGHVLVIPNQHVQTLADVPRSLLAPLFERVQKVELAVEQALSAQGTFVAINNRVSQSVPHLHVHVVPRRKGDGLKGFFWPRHPYTSDMERTEIRDRIRTALSSL